MTAASLAALLGGRRVLRRDVRSDLDLVDAIEGGLPTRAIDELVRRDLLDASEIYDLVIPRRTLAHRRDRGQPLSSEESDRLTRVVRVVGRAEEALGERARAARWLREPNRALSGKRPIDLLDSDVGARMVDRVLGRVEHGVIG